MLLYNHQEAHNYIQAVWQKRLIFYMKIPAIENNIHKMYFIQSSKVHFQETLVQFYASKTLYLWQKLLQCMKQPILKKQCHKWFYTKNATIYWEFLTLLFFTSRSPKYFLETVVVAFSKCVFACMNEIYVYACLPVCVYLCLPAYILFIYDLLKRLHHKISRS